MGKSKQIETLDIGHVKRTFSNNLNVKIAEVYNDTHLETDFPHRHNFYMISLVLAGKGTHIIDFEQVEIKPNRLFFLKPEQVHFWQVEPKSKLATVQFSGDYLAQLFNLNSIPAIQSVFNSYIDLEPLQTSQLLDIFQKIEAENTHKENNSDKIIQALIFTMLAQIERWSGSQSVQQNKSNKSDIVQKFQQLLNIHYKEITTISDYAGQLNITPNYLNMLVKEVTGTTANEQMHKRVLLEAKRLLIHKHTDIAQIAFELGFKDASYFARFFKRSTGISPTEFRNDIYKMYQHHND